MPRTKSLKSRHYSTVKSLLKMKNIMIQRIKAIGNEKNKMKLEQNLTYIVVFTIYTQNNKKKSMHHAEINFTSTTRIMYIVLTIWIQTAQKLQMKLWLSNVIKRNGYRRKGIEMEWSSLFQGMMYSCLWEWIEEDEAEVHLHKTTADKGCCYGGERWLSSPQHGNETDLSRHTN